MQANSPLGDEFVLTIKIDKPLIGYITDRRGNDAWLDGKLLSATGLTVIEIERKLVEAVGNKKLYFQEIKDENN